jgi:protein-disulfide isomerase
VRLGYWHFAFLGDESFQAAEASECAADQDAFWEYHDLLFNNQNGENRGAFSAENLKAFAAELDLDTDEFNQCLDSGKYTEAVSSATGAAQSIGVRSTPAFIVNGQPVVGAQEFAFFQQLIDDELEKSAQ